MCFSITHFEGSPTGSRERVNQTNVVEQDPSNNVLSVSVTILQTLQRVARRTSVPYLSNISSVALGILEDAQTFKGNKGLIKLGEEVCDVVYAISVTCEDLVKNGKPLSKNLEGNLEKLSSSIKRIQAFVTRQLCRHRIARFLTLKSDCGEIQEYRDDLWHFLDFFGVSYQPFYVCLRPETHQIAQLESKNITIGELASSIAGKQQETDQARGSTGREEEANPEPIQRPRAQGVGSSSFRTTFPGFNCGLSFSGNISVNNVDGDQHHSSNEQSSMVNKSYDNPNVSGTRKKATQSSKSSSH
ncbi:hypothetical protein V5O48_012882 [Marasmius crinis-equi]|uniref:RUN domain-containing protein n=1 Tax=Marasmius crinis-equi TaxID=585013 RepID=A0ABR3F1M9_9AGAR